MLNVKNNLIWVKSKLYSERFGPVIFNQLIINILIILAIILAFLINCLNKVPLSTSSKFSSVIEISKDQKIYLDKKQVNINRLDKILKGQNSVIFKMNDNFKYNLFFKISNKLKSLGFKNIEFVRN